MFMILILVAVIVLSMPLGLYLTWLAGVHRRPFVTIMSGRSDFLLLLSGLIGFFPVLATLGLLAFQSNARYLLRGNQSQIDSIWAEERYVWLGTLGVFAGMAMVVLTWEWIRRGKSLAVYNIPRDTLDAGISKVLTGLGLIASRFGNVWSDGRELIAITPTSGLDYATIHLRTRDPRLLEELERNLRLTLQPAATADGQAAGWLYIVGTTCLGAAASAVGLLFYFIYLTR
ncbi:MAG: hypothetical protein ACRC8S_15980 [Fimbriiglobus sp.]